jgi:exosortase/archaeosortase family protein
MTPRRSSALRYLLITGCTMAALYAVLYYPYSPSNPLGRALSWYVTLWAKGTGWVLGLFEDGVEVRGTVILGRFPLRIILDCVALDAQALYAAAVVGFPARASSKAIGLGAGLAAIALWNLARIVLLYFVGVHWQQSFHVMHEEVLQVGIILVACLCFIGWLTWVNSAGQRSDVAGAV